MSDIDSALFHDPSNTGGGHFVKEMELMRSFVEKGIETYFVSPAGFDAVKRVEHRPHLTTSIGYGVEFLIHLVSVFYTLLILRPDRFVPFNTFGGFMGGIISTIIPTRTVLFVRGDTYRGKALTGQFKYRLLKKAFTALEWVTFRTVDRIVFISEHNRRMMLERTGLDLKDVDTVVLYNDVYTDRVKDQLENKSKDLGEGPIVGFAGEFPANRGKGTIDLIDAVAIVEQEFPDLQLYLLGDGQNLSAIQDKAAEHGISERVHTPGWVDDPINYMMAFDLYVLPSYHEGLGNSLLEALACDTPIAGSDIGGIPEVVYDREYLFEARNPSAIAEVLRNVFDSKRSYERALKNAQSRRANFDFDWTENAHQIVVATKRPQSDRIPDVPIPDQLGKLHADA